MSASARIKPLVLLAAKLCGAYAVARLLTRHRIRIIAYHGIALADEHLFRPRLFMRPENFQRRLEWLARSGHQVIGLDDAENLLDGRHGVRLPTVITIDDGWQGTYDHALPALERFGLGATMYVTSYHMERGTPVFNVALGYLLWRSPLREFDPAGAHVALSGLAGGMRSLGTSADQDAIAAEIAAVAVRDLDEDGRVELLRALAAALQVDLDGRLEAGCFRLMGRGEVADAARRGFAIELHTHRHTLSLDDPRAAREEIEENRARLAALTGYSARHLCYPSGEFNRRQWPWLRESGVRTATCTFPGLCGPGSEPLALPRLVDDDTMSLLEFEAELSGFMDLVRRLRGGKGHFSHYETTSSDA